MQAGDILFIVLCTVGLCMLVLYMCVPRIQESIIFEPIKLAPSTLHEAIELASFEWCNTLDGERLAVRYIPRSAERVGTSPLTSIFFHGRRGSIVHAMKQAQRDADQGMDVYMVDYRGYGASTGTPSEQGLRLDAETISRYVQESGVPRSRIVLHGYSLGCVAALHVATTTDDYAMVVLESPFAKLSTATMHIYPYLRPLQYFMTSQFNNLEAARAMRYTPLFVTHSSDDECVSYDDARAVYAACNSRIKHFLPSPLQSHAGPHMTQAAYDWIFSHLHHNRH